MKAIHEIGALFAAMIFATTCFAHEGPRVWIDVDDGRVMTLLSDNDAAPTTYAPSRLFTTEFEEFFGIYTTNFPGYEVRRDGGSVSAETTFGFNIAGPLLYFDDTMNTFVTVRERFGQPEPGPVPQVAVSLDSEIRETEEGPVAGFDFYTFHATGDHAHLTYTFLGDGSTASDGPAGVYALPLQLTSAGFTDSATFYLLVGKDVEQTDPLFLSAIAVAQATLVSTTVPGDMNCSGALDEADIPDFVEALLNPDGYTADHPDCDILRGDLNDDENVNGLDIPLLVAGVLH